MKFIPEYRRKLPPILSEEQYEEEMVTIVEPALNRIRQMRHIDTIDGRFLSYEYYACEAPRALIVISHGFTESAEKFREMTWYFLQSGYQVVALDHCGHGRSYRYVKDTSITHIEHFDDYVDDLHCLVERLREECPDLPFYIYGHSMGGGIAARHLIKYPDDFQKAVLTAPMIAPATNGIPVWVGKALASGNILLGKKQKRIFLHRPFNPEQTFEKSADTSRARFEYYKKKCVENQHLQNSSATYGWTKEALNLTKTLLNKKNCQKIQIPVLLFQAEKDDFVRLPEQIRFLSQIPHGYLKRMAGTKHEIYSSTNDVMKPYLKYILQFYYKK